VPVSEELTLHGGGYSSVIGSLCVVGRVVAEHVLCLLASISLMFHLFLMSAEVSVTRYEIMKPTVHQRERERGKEREMEGEMQRE
jgi:hypothetical protein